MGKDSFCNGHRLHHLNEQEWHEYQQTSRDLYTQRQMTSWCISEMRRIGMIVNEWDPLTACHLLDSVEDCVLQMKPVWDKTEPEERERVENLSAAEMAEFRTVVSAAFSEKLASVRQSLAGEATTASTV